MLCEGEAPNCWNALDAKNADRPPPPTPPEVCVDLVSKRLGWILNSIVIRDIRDELD